MDEVQPEPAVDNNQHLDYSKLLKTTTRNLRRHSLNEIDQQNIINSGPRNRTTIKNMRKTIHDVRNFLGDFDPEKSARERRKLSRKTTTGTIAPTQVVKGGSLYDSKGFYRVTGEDLCDCLDIKCAGCHFPCPNCSSLKCGATCRCSRKWMYEQIEYDAKDECIQNTYTKPKNQSNR